MSICIEPNCNQPTNLLLDGKPYCTEHYREKFMGRLMSEYEGWQVNAKPSSKLRYMLGRFQQEFCNCSGGSYLSSARVRDRGFNFRKTELGGEFSITRHLNAWSSTKMMQRVVESWGFNLATREFQLVSTYPWTASCPD